MVSGVRLQLHTPLPQQSRRPTTRLYRPEEIAFYNFEILRRLRIGAIEEVPPECSTPAALRQAWFSPEHLVPKKSDLPFRTVYNGHALSQYLVTPPTRIHDLRYLFSHLPEGAWIYGYDLRDAFYSILVHPEDRQMLLFSFLGKLYRYRALPMGISPSASHLCEMTMCLCEHWSKQEIVERVSISPYYDDLNGWALSLSTGRLHSSFIASEIELLGLHWNKTKSMPEPSQTAVVLGYLINTVTMTASLPGAKLQRLIDLAVLLHHRRRASPRELLSMAGKLMDARYASSLFRACAYALYPHVSSALDWDTLLDLSPEALERLHFFATQAPLLNGMRFRYQPAVATVLATDARPTHWTITLLRGPHAGQALNGRWEDLAELRGLDLEKLINFLELYVLLLALEKFESFLRGTTLWWWVDNQVALSYLRRCGGPVHHLRVLTWRILERAQAMGVFFTPPRYVQSSNNPADYGTRHQDLDSVRISPFTFDRLNLLWGPFTMDLFADATNALCPCFFTMQPQEGAAGTNALLHDWSRIRRAWLFPPTHLLPQVVEKLLLQPPRGSVLIVPVLTTAPWWSPLMKLSPQTLKLHRQDFKVDGPDTSSIFLSLGEHFLAVRIP